MVAPVVIDERHTVFGSRHQRIVRIGRNHSVGDRFGSLGFGDIGLDIRQTHGHAQFQRVGVLDPLADVAEVDVVELAERIGRKLLVGMERGQNLVQLLEHLRIDLLLRVVGDGKRFGRIVDDLGIRNRSVGVGHAVHDRHAQQLGQCEGHLVVGVVDDAAIIGVNLLHDDDERPPEPVGRRIECGEFLFPAVGRLAHVSGEGIAGERFVELVAVLLHRYDEVLQPADIGTDFVILPLELLVRSFRRIPVDPVENARTPDRTEQHESRQQNMRYMILFHTVCV